MIRPKSSKRKLDLAETAFRTLQLATGELEGAKEPELTERQRFARSGGKVGGKARAKALTKAQRHAIAVKAAKARWGSTMHRPATN